MRWCSPAAVRSASKRPPAYGGFSSARASDSTPERPGCRWLPRAILYDLGIGKADVRPDPRNGGGSRGGRRPMAPWPKAAVGAGTGATVGKILGMRQAMKGGVGTATVALEGRYQGVLVSALAAVNALGDVCDPRTGQILAGSRRSPDSSEFAGTERLMLEGGPPPALRRNTTLAVVATNARLTKVQATKMAQMSQAGMTRAIRPAHTMSDGDIVFGLSAGELAVDVSVVGVAAARALEQAIVRSVRQAWALGGVPGLGTEPRRPAL